MHTHSLILKNYNFVVWRLKALGVPFFCGTYEHFDVDTLKHYVPTHSFVGRTGAG